MASENMSVAENGGSMEGVGQGLLPRALLAALPSDPLDQLDLARKIAVNAMSSRINKLETEAANLRAKLVEKETLVSRLQSQIADLDRSLRQTTDRLSLTLDDQAKLAAEKNVLTLSVQKLTRDVAKLEAFKRTLLQSLEEEKDGSSEVDASLKSPGNQAAPSNSSSASNSYFNGTKQMSQTGLSLTPSHLTPLGSPKRESETSSPKFQSARVSPRRVSRGASGAPRFLSQPPSQHTTAPNSPPHGGLALSSLSFNAFCQSARADGKEFFRQARSRLTYEQFSNFLANIKELNAQRQTREETLRKADEIFGPDNKDLHNAFYGLLSRHIPNSG